MQSGEPTSDVDITPSTTTENLQRLAAALRELQARIRTATEPDGLPFAASAQSLRGVMTLNLQTPIGELDLTFSPAGTEGYPDLARSATTHQVASVQVRVAALGDVIRLITDEGVGRGSWAAGWSGASLPG